MKYTHALENLEIQPTFAGKHTSAISELLRQEYSLFELLVSLSFNQYREIELYLEQQMGRFFCIFARLNSLVDESPIPPSAGLKAASLKVRADEGLLLKVLRAEREIQTFLKRLIAVEAIFKSRPEWEEFMVSVVEFHEENSAVIEHSLNHRNY